jgi:hypothetical protein
MVDCSCLLLEVSMVYFILFRVVRQPGKVASLESVVFGKAQ